jgi:hypothetical protein
MSLKKVWAFVYAVTNSRRTIRGNFVKLFFMDLSDKCKILEWVDK